MRWLTLLKEIAPVNAQTVNLGRGDAKEAAWTDQYECKLNHAPGTNETARFRKDNSMIIVTAPSS